MKTAYLFLTFTLMHFVASVSAFLWSYRVSSDAFDGRQLSWFSRNLAQPLSDLLWLPIVSMHRWSTLDGLWGYLPIIANSLLWGLALVLIIKWFSSDAFPVRIISYLSKRVKTQTQDQSK